MEKINKNTLMKQVRNEKFVECYIAPSNVNSFHIKGGWHIGMRILLTVDRENNIHYVSEPNEDSEPLQVMISNYAYYNCNSELGRNVRFWMEG